MSIDMSFRPRTYRTEADTNGASGAGVEEADDRAVVIASIELESVLSDFYLVHAEQDGAGMRYSVWGEYVTVFEVSPETSTDPLTMAELVQLIDTAPVHDTPGLVEPVLDLNHLDGGVAPAELLGFIRVTSPFYPQLEEYYRGRIRAWAAKAEGAAASDRVARDEG